MKKGNNKMFRRVLSLLLTVLTVASLVPATAWAASYDVAVSDGDVYTVNVGDTIYLTNPRSSKEFAFWAYNWFTGGNDGGVIALSHATNSRYATVTAKKAGTVTVQAVLDGSVEVIKTGEKYNSAKKRWESYTYTTYKSRSYEDTVTIKVVEKEKPVITAQPKNVTVPRGETAKVTVKATGKGLSYKWYFKNAGDSKFSYTSSFTGSSYSVAMSDARNKRQVYCVITDQNGNKVTSNTVTLYMGNPVKVTAQPKSVTVANGETAKVTVKATGDGLSYKWYYRNIEQTAFSYTGTFKGKSYQVEMNEDRDDRQVYCVVSDQYGNSVKTNIATLQMEHPAAVITQPKSVRVPSGSTAKVSVEAVGDGLSYKWYFKNAGDSKFSYTSSFAGSSYSVAMSSARAGRQVYCVITDKYGHQVKTNTVTLNMGNPLKITAQPKNAGAVEGKSATVSVKAVGDGLCYQWYFKNAGASRFSYTSSFTGSSYSVAMSEARDKRQVYCVITDQYGDKVTTNTVTLSMAAPLKITAQPSGKTVASGATVSTKVSATGTGTLKYQWYVKNVGDGVFSKSSVTGATYSYTMTKEKSGRQVYCVITDNYGQKVTSKTVTLSMAAPITVTKQPVSAQVLLGETVTTSVAATGTGALKYQWYVKNPGDGAFSKSSVTGPTYSYAMTKEKSGRQVYCVITDNYGQKVQTDTVTLKKVPDLVITKDVQDISMPANTGSAVFRVEVSGSGPFEYQWYYKKRIDKQFWPGWGLKDNELYYCTYPVNSTNQLPYDNRGMQVYCVITDSYGRQVTTRTATLRLY